MDKLLAGIDAAAVELSPDGGATAAEAILTTDAGPKTAVAEATGSPSAAWRKGRG